MVLTSNEGKVLLYLWRRYQEQQSINGLARQTGITPKGAYKILQKLEREGLVVKKIIGNATIYSLNFPSSKTEDLLKYVLKSELAPNPYVKVLQKDLEPLQELTEALIIFGSAITKGLPAHDIDVLIVLTKENLAPLQTRIKEIEKTIPKKIHPVYQTKTDLQKNLQKKDPVVMAVLHKGFILWGYEALYELIKSDANKNAS